MARLVENVKRDGVLSATVLVFEDAKSGNLEILSGHHRTKAAVLAGLEEITAQVIVTPLTEQQKIAIQLSHNSIAGSDDPNLLADLYSALDLTWKEYSGLTDDDVLDFQGVDLTGIGGGSIKYEELTILFLSEDRETFDAALKRFEKEAKGRSAKLASLADYEKVFDAIVATKRYHNVSNSAVAISIMADLALQRLDQLQAEAEDKANAA